MASSALDGELVEVRQRVSGKRIPIVRLDERQATALLEMRWMIQNRGSGDSRTLTLLLQHLRQTGIISIPRPSKVRSSSDRLLGDYGQFRRQERCSPQGPLACTFRC